MMAANDSGRRGARNRKITAVANVWLIGLLLGLVGGVGLAVIYPPPSVDVIKVQATDWAKQMRNLIAPSDTSTTNGKGSNDTQVYAAPPIALPPESATDDDAAIENVSELVNVEAPKPDVEQLTATLDEAMDELGLLNRMAVVDVASGETLYDVGGDDTIVPASTLKLFTAATVVEHLGLDHRFVTSAGYDPAAGVVLIGGGDGLLSTGESTGETMGYAGLADLAEETWEAISGELEPTDSGTMNVWADVSRYDQPWTHPAWTESLMTGGWVSPIYPLNTFGGFYVNPTISDEAVDDGAQHAGSAYAGHLTELAAADGYQVEFSYAGQQAQPTQVEPIAEVRSARLEQQLEYAMKQSNNMLFEMFGREAALAAGNSPDFSGAETTMLTTMDHLGVATDQFVFVDSSGLSQHSRATLNSTVELFEAIMDQDHLRPIMDTLTIAGYDGTMRYRMDEAPYSGIVRSKTGTLDVASANVGMTVTTDGRALWFGINTVGAQQDYAAARAEQDHLAQVLTDCGCGGE